MSSDTDSDDDQLFTKTAHNIKKKRQNNNTKLEELQKAMNSVPEQELEHVFKEFNSVEDFSLVKTQLYKHNKDTVVISDSDDDNIPLAVLLERSKEEIKQVKSSRTRAQKRKSISDKSEKTMPKPTKKSGKRKRRTQNRNQVSDPTNVIILDDDTCFSTAPLQPINFNTRCSRSNNMDFDRSNIMDLSSVSIPAEDEEDESFDGDATVTIMVEWHNGKSNTRKGFNLRKYEKLETVFQELAKLENLPTSRILLMHDYNFVKPADTPSSLGFKFYGALSGSVSKSDVHHNQSNLDLVDQDEENSNKGVISVKLKLESKKTLIFKVMKHQKAGELLKMCSEELKCEENKIKIIFDGECLQPDQKMLDLDVEDGDIFEVCIKS